MTIYMKKILKKIRSHKIAQALSSVKIMVVCLALLFILTFWGTAAQVNLGLYQAQQKFFYSWFFFFLGFIPFPGARLILWVMFVNLTVVLLARFVYKWSNLGLLIIHLGLLLYFYSAFVIFHFSQESQMTLLEGEGSNVSSAYHDWELSVWEEREGFQKDVFAYDVLNFHPGRILDFDDLMFQLTVENFYPNAQAYTSGIKYLSSLPIHKEPEKNLPGGIFQLTTADGNALHLLLYAGEKMPTQIEAGDRKLNFALRPKRFVLPFTLTLKQFDMEIYPGTETARSYQSKVQIEDKNLSREVLIYMNNPLRYKDFTFYQASYSIDDLGREHSTLAVVKNGNRLLPYIACFVTFLGLVTHFLVMGIFRKR